MKSSAYGLTTAALVLAGALSVSVAGPHRAYAAPSLPATEGADGNLAITVLSPMPHTSFSGSKPVEISAFYQGTDSNAISSIELYVDGASAYTKQLAAPEARGVISFLIDVSQLTPGAHTVVLRAVATDAEVVSAKTSFVYVVEQADPTNLPTAQAPTVDNSLPELAYVSPKEDDQVAGIVRVMLNATSPDGKSPYVSLFIDRTFKTLRNYAPYEYDWDTTAYTNGYHTIEAYAYDEAQNVGPAQVLRVYVNNPGGRTDLRTDLQDALPPAPPAKPAPTPTRGPAVLAMGTSTHRAATPKPMLMARLPQTDGLDSVDANLSSPFVPYAAPQLPSPLVAFAQPVGRQALMRPIMMASRDSVLDRTGGLDPESQLSDPFIPDTASPRPGNSQAQAPTTGEKQLPAKVAATSTALTSVVVPKQLNAINSPALIGRDAHTVPVRTMSPALTPPKIEVIAAPMVKAAHPKPIAIHTAAVVAAKPKPVALHTAAPVVAPESVDVHLTVPATQPKPIGPIAEHFTTPIVAPALAEVHVDVPAAQPKPMAMHTSSTMVAPKLAEVRVDVPAAQAKPVAIHMEAPALTPNTVVRLMAPALTSTRTIAVATPKATAVRPQVARFVVPAAATTVHHTIAVHLNAVPQIMRVKGQMKVLYNHAALRLDRPLAIHSGVMFSPLRQIFEFQGGSLTWHKGTVHATSDSKDITLKIGDHNATVNDKTLLLEQPPYLVKGRTMVPLSFLPMALDVNVQFDPASGHLLITTKD